MLRKILSGLLVMVHAVVCGQVNDDFAGGNSTQQPEWSEEVEKSETIAEALHSNEATGGFVFPNTRSETLVDAAWQDVVINEWMPDPNPVVTDLPEAEYVELYNSSSHSFSLQGWSLKGKALPDVTLLPGQHVILTKATNAADFAPYGEVIGLSSWPTLSNSGSTLVLKNPSGQTVDSVGYVGSEVEGGYAIERINPNPPCDQRRNYANSVSANGGTPGAQNSLFDDQPDTTPPRLEKAVTSGPRQLQLYFDEAVAAANVRATLDPAIPISSTQAEATDERVVVLQLAEDLRSGTNYTIMIEGARDCSGNEAASLTATFFYDNTPPTVAQVVLRDTATVRIDFDEPLASAGSKADYAIDRSIGPARSVQLLDDSTSVLVDFLVSLDNGLNRLTVTGATDRFGNTADSLTYDITFRNDIDTVRVVSAYQVDIEFAVAPSVTSVEQVENYRIDRDLGHPNVAIPLSATAIQLIYDRPLSANRGHELQIDRLVDAEGNPLSTPAYRFAYDQKIPTLDSVVAVDARTLIAHFNETMRWDAQQPPTAFTVNRQIGSPERVELLSDKQSFKLYLSKSLTQETTYKLAVIGLSDRAGNLISSVKKEEFLYDQQAPQLQRWHLIAPHQIQLEFHEPLNAPSAQSPSAYQLNSDLYPDSVAVLAINSGRVILRFGEPLPEATLTLEITQLTDQLGNALVEPIAVTIENQYPALGHVVSLSATEVQLDFTQALDASTMERVDNYLLDSLTPPTHAKVVNHSVVLTWPEPFVTKKEQSLAVPRVVNQAKQEVEGATIYFTYDPKVTSITVDRSALLIDFTVPLDTRAATNVSHYKVSEVGTPVAAIRVDPQTIRLVFSQPFDRSTVYTLTLDGLLDQDYNIIPASQHRFGQGQTPAYHQLLITEIMADPSPAVGLPAAEYVELFNTSDQLLSTAGLRFADAGTTVVLPTTLLLPGEYVVLCNNADQADWADYGRTISVSQLPSLNGTGDSLRLTDAFDQEIFSVAYSDDWYQDAEKKNGGWSLEMVDSQRPCGEQDNWTASVDPAGGTPGRANSVRQSNPDNFGPRVQQVFAVNDTVVHVLFNEKLSGASARSAQLRLNEGLAAQAIEWLPAQKKAIITLTQKLLTRRCYSVRVEGVSDCSGNLIGEADNTATFVLPEAAEVGDVLLSELLFYPRSSGVDFVELYNHSDKQIDLQDWFLANLKDDSLVNLASISAEPYLLAPGTYVALSEAPPVLKADYPAAPRERLLRVDALPSLPAEAGTVVLLNPAREVVQRFSYADRYHHPILNDPRGVSLERIAWDNPTDDRASWQSAAKSVGYATPGYRNSQQADGSLASATISVEPPVFAPGYAGHADYTRIRYRFERAGTVANVIVYDAQGRKVRDLARNTTLAETGYLVWDGTTDDRQRAGIGYYLIFFEVFDTQGRVNVFKEKVVVGGAL